MAGVVGFERVGAVTAGGWMCVVSGTGLEWSTGVGESPVRECRMCCLVLVCPSSSGLVESAVNLPGPPGKPEYPV